MTKIALAMIVKGSDDEAKVLDRCLKNVAPYVDGIFITRTQRPDEPLNDAVAKVAKKHNAHLSDFTWVNDFAAARNFNFSQVPKDYTHILWADADDVFRGLNKLRPTLDDNPYVDAFAFFYLYDFDEHKRPTTVHQKTQVIKNDGCVEWVGALHEDFKENRSVRRVFVDGIERIHMSSHERVIQSRERNVEIATLDAAARPDDPRSYWNLGNAQFGAGKLKDSLIALSKFMELSHSDDEKYMTLLRIAAVQDNLGDQTDARDTYQRAIGLKPEYPDAYHHLGGLYFKMKQYEKARDTFLLGLTKRPPIYQIIAYNPRDYDYNPMMQLAKTFIFLNRPDSALTFLEACHKIQPKDDSLARIIKEMRTEAKAFDEAITYVAKLEAITDKEELRKALNDVPEDLQSHPQICFIRNRNFIKETSSGKDLAIYCGPTAHEWNPALFQTKGFGGSEEAIIHLSKHLSELGFNVSVYANCGHKATKYGDVMWSPYWAWNYRDKQDIVILWRSPKGCDYPINADKIYIDLHDAIQPGEFTENRLAKITKIFVKTNFHRSLFPAIPDDKFAIIPNGIDFSLFRNKVRREPHLLVNTSSPDRSLDVLPKLFKEVKRRVPDAQCLWAYGWDVYDAVHGNDDHAMKWKKKIQKDLADAGIQELGRLTQAETAKLYQRAHILAYPTEFAEIDCITVKKAQAAGCIPVTTDFGALDESVQFGIKVHSKKTKDTWSKPYQLSYGLEDEHAQSEWVARCVALLQTKTSRPEAMQQWAKQFAWATIAKQWYNILTV